MTTSSAEEYVHSEYYYGSCFAAHGYIFYKHLHFDHLQVMGKLILRLGAQVNQCSLLGHVPSLYIKTAWIDVPRIPTCIILRATSSQDDLFRHTSYNFQLCVPRITYCHTHMRYKYHFLEWYIPANMTGGMDWEVYFFGPESSVW